jgi:hypothetical protein
MHRLALVVLLCGCSRNPTEAEALDAFTKKQDAIARFEKQIVASYSSGQIVSVPPACKRHDQGPGSKKADAADRTCAESSDETQRLACIVREQMNGLAEADRADRECIRGYNEAPQRINAVHGKLEPALVTLAHEIGATGWQVTWFYEGIDAGNTLGGIRWGVNSLGGAKGVVMPHEGAVAPGGYRVGYGRYDGDSHGFTSRHAVPFDAGEILVEVSFPID